MQTDYRNNFHQNSFILPLEEETDTGSYMIRMLLNNNIPFLLPCTIQTINHKDSFHYDITGKTAFSDYYAHRSLDFEDLRLLLEQFTLAAAKISSYLLNINHLLLTPNHIYLDSVEECLRFCYFPGCHKDIRVQFCAFMEYLLPKINHGDQPAVILGYGIYKEALEHSFHLDRIKQLLYEAGPKAPADAGIREEMPDYKTTPQQEELRQEAMREFFERGDEDHPLEKKRFPPDTVISSIIWTIVLLGICILRGLGYLSFLTLPMMLGIFIIVLVILGFNAWILKKTMAKDNRMPEKWLQQNVTQASIQWPGKKVVESEEIREWAEEKINSPIPDISLDSSSSPDLSSTQPLPNLCAVSQAALIPKTSQKAPPIPLGETLTLIGSLAGTADGLIPLPTVSRLHAKLMKEQQSYYLTDLGSTNGTYLNGRALSPQSREILTPGDEISFGNTAYIFRPGV